MFYLFRPIVSHTCCYFSGLCTSNIPRYILDFAKPCLFGLCHRIVDRYLCEVYLRWTGPSFAGEHLNVNRVVFFSSCLTFFLFSLYRVEIMNSFLPTCTYVLKPYVCMCLPRPLLMFVDMHLCIYVYSIRAVVYKSSVFLQVSRWLVTKIQNQALMCNTCTDGIISHQIYMLQSLRRKFSVKFDYGILIMKKVKIYSRIFFLKKSCTQNY